MTSVPDTARTVPSMKLAELPASIARNRVPKTQPTPTGTSYTNVLSAPSSMRLGVMLVRASTCEAPSAPVAPVNPTPVSPTTPCRPCSPCNPRNPIGPISPLGPCNDPALIQEVPDQAYPFLSDNTTYKSPTELPVAGRAETTATEPFTLRLVPSAPVGPAGPASPVSPLGP